jgi:5-(carboxyamino)imidazole ribonucleotide mutase
MPKVAIIMGSDSDFPVLKATIKRLKSFGIETQVHVLSAHRTPDEAAAFARNAEQAGVEVIIAAAGMAAHLAGVLAANTPLPVIGIPMKSSQLDGMDALLSTVMMPPGVPVATVGINGADNAALLALQMLSIKYADIRAAIKEQKLEMARKVSEKDAAIQAELADI